MIYSAAPDVIIWLNHLNIKLVVVLYLYQSYEKMTKPVAPGYYSALKRTGNLVIIQFPRVPK